MRHVGWIGFFIVGGLLSFACSGVTGDPDLKGSGGVSNSGSGGRAAVGSGGRSASGGASAASGGAELGGETGNGGDPNVCTEAAEEPCADHSTAYPIGSAVCEDGEWDVSDCTFCEPGAKVECATIDAETPDGTLKCAEDGLDWTKDPKEVCEACDPDAESADCDSAKNVSSNRGGSASCQSDGSYDWSECTLCDSEVEPPSCSEATEGARPIGEVVCKDETAWDTEACVECDPLDYEAKLDCVDLPVPEHAFTGGVAYCGTDASWNQSTCEYCGDGAKNGTEQCEASVPSGVTCEDGGFVGDITPIDACTEECLLDVSVCSACDLEFEYRCLGESDSENCVDAECKNSQCGASYECDMGCGWGTDCTGLSCNTGAICNIDCGGGGAECSVDCQPGSNCNLLSTNSWQASITGTFNCADGGECAYDFGAGPEGTIDVTINCESGSTCEVISKQYHQHIELVHCAAGATCVMTAAADKASTFVMECEAGADCGNCPNGSTCDCTGLGCP